MIGIGTIVNVLAVIVGGSFGLMLKGGLKKRFQDILMQALGLATLFIGVSGALQGIFVIQDNKLKTTGTMIMIASLTIGALVGEWIGIENHLESLGVKIETIIKSKHQSNFVEGFVTNTLVICVGAMAVVGALQDGITHDASMLYAKSVLDAIISCIFAATLGLGVIFAAIPLGIYQGLITVAASVLEPLMSDQLIGNISFVGSILIFGIGINLTFGKKIKVGNMIPALIIPVVYEMILKLKPLFV